MILITNKHNLNYEDKQMTYIIPVTVIEKEVKVLHLTMPFVF